MTYSAPEIARILKLCKLSREDKQIAVSRIIWRMKYADIGANVNMDRTTASDHFRRIIVPEIRRRSGTIKPLTEARTV